MKPKTKFDMKSAKEMLLYNAGCAYYALGRANSGNTHQEEELIAYAMFKVLEKDTESEERFLELRGLSYMLKGIADNLRLMGGELAELNEEKTEVLF